MPVRSGRLASGTLAANTSRNIFTVPADTTILVKNLAHFFNGTGTADMHIWLKDGPAAHLPFMTVTMTGAKGGQTNLWLALSSMTQLMLDNRGGAITNYWLSGAVLPGVIAPLPATLPA